MKFYGRAKELQALNDRYGSRRKEFGVIYGRRRVGKTALIEEFAKDKDAILFQAKRDSAYGNLESFSLAIAKRLSLPGGYVFPSYEAAFDAILEGLKEERFLLVIDEFPYILEQMPSFSSYLQEFFDRAGDNLFLLISGSDISLLEKEILSHNSPLYKRRSFEMRISKMTYREALLFLEPFSNEEKSAYLSLMSTFPYYLAAINPSLSFEDNLKRLLFDPYGTFFNLPDQILSNATRVQDIYNAILLAIANRQRNVASIASRIKESEAKVAKYLVTLQGSEIVRKCETFMGSKKTIYYEIDDPLLEFWYAFIFKNEERIRINGEIVFKELKEKIGLYISHGFENICRLYLDQKNIDGELDTVYPPLKPYRVEKSKLGRSVEIDGLSRSGNSLLVIECKYRNQPFDKAMLDHLLESVSVFPSKLDRHYYIFSKSGFGKDVLSLEGDDIRLVSFDDLFR